ncbi:uncharacterized protein LOC110024136 [Phalaenopsis equestris]|uniref:uncharacterized protein LOC110024136 n=1 Tax=Phalaenopsis equestris TaxID=78828 RepID=UPI0009E376D1|nr:uncharacterized protein LOC110024136 [Phalaenopsis equestris]
MHETIRSYADLVHRVEAQITADDAINAHKEQFEKFGGKHKGDAGDNNQSSQRRKFEQQRNRDIIPQPAGQRTEYRPKKEYTPLNTSRANILMSIKDEQAVKWPHALKPNSGDQEQYCHFHRSRGHSTEACKKLKEEIERLIKQGYLGRFVKNKPADIDNASAGGQHTPRQQHGGQPVVGEIQTIAGGPSLIDQVLVIVPGEPMQKKLCLEPITFDDSDLEGVRVPH